MGHPVYARTYSYSTREWGEVNGATSCALADSLLGPLFRSGKGSVSSREFVHGHQSRDFRKYCHVTYDWSNVELLYAPVTYDDWFFYYYCAYGDEFSLSTDYSPAFLAVRPAPFIRFPALLGDSRGAKGLRTKSARVRLCLGLWVKNNLFLRTVRTHFLCFGTEKYLPMDFGIADVSIFCCFSLKWYLGETSGKLYSSFRIELLSRGINRYLRVEILFFELRVRVS